MDRHELASLFRDYAAEHTDYETWSAEIKNNNSGRATRVGFRGDYKDHSQILLVVIVSFEITYCAVNLWEETIGARLNAYCIEYSDPEFTFENIIDIVTKNLSNTKPEKK